MRTTSAGLLLAGAVLLAGCGGGSEGHAPATTPPAPAVTTASPTPDIAGLIAACKTAVAAGLDVGSGAPQCNALPRSDYLKALHEVDAEAQKKFNDDTNRAASATP
jgi:hypothetical protein